MLSPEQQRLCLKTISSSSLFYLALDALKKHKGFSIVRMADGEKHLYDLILSNSPETHLLPDIKGGTKWLAEARQAACNRDGVCTEKWLKNMGLYDITLGELQSRMDYAAINATFFAPSPSGLVNPEYNVYDYWPERSLYAEHFFNCIWPNEWKEKLYREAEHVLCIHGNVGTADSMQLRVQANLNVKVSFIKLNNWTQTKGVIEKAKTCTAPLVVFSGGPSGKMIGPALAEAGKVVLDIGNNMDRWTLSHLPINRDAANQFHREWTKTNKQWA